MSGVEDPRAAADDGSAVGTVPRPFRLVLVFGDTREFQRPADVPPSDLVALQQLLSIERDFPPLETPGAPLIGEQRLCLGESREHTVGAILSSLLASRRTLSI